MRSSYLIELAAGNAATLDQILGWSPHTRVYSKRQAIIEADKYRARGFWVRVTFEAGYGRIGKQEVFSPIRAPINPNQGAK